MIFYFFNLLIYWFINLLIQIPTSTHPNRVGILDGVGGVVGRDMVDFSFANFSSSLRIYFIFKEHSKMPALYWTYDFVRVFILSLYHIFNECIRTRWMPWFC